MARAADRAGSISGAEREQGAGRARDPGPGRPGAVQAAVRGVWRSSRSAHRSSSPCGLRRSRTAACAGVRHADGARASAPGRGADRGTFLGGQIHIGSRQSPGGRAGDRAARSRSPSGCASCRSGRAAEDRHAAAHRRAHDRLQRAREQPGDDPRRCSRSSATPRSIRAQVPCHITHTNRAPTTIIRADLERSPCTAA